jgi:hypothetical protein
LSACRPAHRGRFQALVKRIAHPSRAIVPVIVVAVIAIFRADFPQEVCREFLRLRAGERQALGADGAVLIDVGGKLFPRRLRSGKIEHPPAQESQHEILLGEVEKTKIEHVIQSAPRITNPDRVVSESLPVDFARAVSDQPGFGRFPRVRVGGKHVAGRQTTQGQQKAETEVAGSAWRANPRGHSFPG